MKTPDSLHLEAALKQFGWECGPEFERRYYTDPWVFNLANAVDKLTYENERLRASKDALVKKVKRLEDRIAFLSPGWRP